MQRPLHPRPASRRTEPVSRFLFFSMVSPFPCMQLTPWQSGYCVRLLTVSPCGSQVRILLVSSAPFACLELVM
jgi:hypothetical protein